MSTWNYVVKRDFVDAHGDKIAGQFVALLMRVASTTTPGDVIRAQADVQEGCASLGVKLAPKDVIDIAQNLTDPQHDILLFAEESGTIIAEHRLRRAAVAA